ncbi:MAG TPA: Nif3-like dinuclear metal center hexameric protein [Bacteroidales bacterium]|nr:Nif3-like dinuclear metal center hexameric protein [Bacteroidales bacterium]
MKLKELCSFLDSELPLSFQESYDNSGLQVGDSETEIKSALLTVDVTEEIVEEAVHTGSELIISHHPLIFSGLKRISGRNSTEKIISSCIKNDIAVYSAHTNLDITHHGVSRKLAEKLGLEQVIVLVPLEKRLFKLVTFVPESHLDKVRNAIFDAGSGSVGNYDRCGFTVPGKGSFRPNENTDPFVGEKGKMNFEEEIRFETVLFSHMKDRVVKAMIEAHPYEEVAYDLYPLENRNIDAGLGCSGLLNAEMSETDFLRLLSERLGAEGIRYSKLTGRKIRKVALCGGAGSSLLNDAVACGADVFVTGDIKYHSFFDAGNRILLVDAGHYETEKFAPEIIKELIIKKFPKFALRFSEVNTNPINYL